MSLPISAAPLPFVPSSHPNIIEGRHVVFEDLSEDVVTILLNQHFSYFLQISAPVYPDLVFQFYNSLNLHKDKSITVEVAGNVIGFTPAELGELFHLPLEGLQHYTKKNWIPETPTFKVEDATRTLSGIPLDRVFEDPDYTTRRPAVQNLSSNNFILLKLLKENIIPAVNKDKQIGVFETTILYFLLTHQKISLPHIMVQHMHEAKTKSNKPYGMAITYILAKKGILELSPYNPRLFDTEYLVHCGLIKVHNVFYTKNEFQILPSVTQARFAPRRSTSSIPSNLASSSREEPEDEGEEAPQRTRKLRRSKSSAAAMMSPLASQRTKSSSSFKKLKKFITKAVVEPIKELTKAVNNLKERVDQIEARRKNNEDRPSRRRNRD